MTADPQRAGQRPAGLLAPVPPSRLVRMVMRPLTRMLNPVVGTLAGRTFAWRPRSGTSAVAPAGAT